MTDHSPLIDRYIACWNEAEVASAMRLVATCVLGLEEILEAELSALGAAEIEREKGAVSFSGRWQDCWRANWRLRTANRVLVELGSERQLKQPTPALALD